MNLHHYTLINARRVHALKRRVYHNISILSSRLTRLQYRRSCNANYGRTSSAYRLMNVIHLPRYKIRHYTNLQNCFTWSFYNLINANKLIIRFTVYILCIWCTFGAKIKTIYLNRSPSTMLFWVKQANVGDPNGIPYCCSESQKVNGVLKFKTITMHRQ